LVGVPPRLPPAPIADAFVWSDGVRVAGTDIHCDARRCPAEATAFVSHARAPRLRGGADVRLVTTERTRLLRAVEVAPRGQAAATLVTPFGRPFALGRLRIELLPSGHAPGAAQLYVELDGRRVGYLGPINPQPSRFAEPLQVRAADAICVEAPLAVYGRKLPPRAEAEAALAAAVTRALDDGATPVVLASPPGAVEIVAQLVAAGLPLRLHPRLVAWLEGYARCGLPLRAPEGSIRPFRGSPARGEVVVWPLEARNAPAIGRLRSARLLAATGAALDPDLPAKLRVDAAFALADHGDLPSLVAHAVAAEARDVWLTSGYGEEPARAFAAAGIRLHALQPHRAMQQMALFPD
jgi:putative mRNA 3-end processing factor